MKPLFTLFVYAFNQEAFIREAIAGAFSQTYVPTEIILSDDCSTDNTWEIMREMAESYKGSHRIILNRNEKNLGITAHINRIMQLGSGDWFVLGAGDDISLPDRIQIIYDAIKQYPSAYGVATALMNIDKSGMEIGYHNFDMEHPYVTGASSAWHMKCFKFFGEITQHTTAEDIIMPFRSVLLGELLLIKYPTVKYRYHEESISNPLNMDLVQAWKHLKKIKYQLIHACEQRLLDLERVNHLVFPSVYEELERKHKQLINGFEADIENVSLRCRIWEADLASKLTYVMGTGGNLPNKHKYFYYRMKTFISSFKWIQSFLQSKRPAKDDRTLKQTEPVRAIKVQDLLNPDIGLLIYL